MFTKVNCVYASEYGKCFSPNRKKTLGLFKQGCNYWAGKRCDIKVEKTPRPNVAPVGQKSSQIND